MSIQEIISEVLEHLRGMWRYRWYAALVSWAIAIASWYYVYMLPDQYEARAKVYVDTDSLMGPVFEGLALRDDVSSQIEAVSRALLTRPNLEEVARETDLDLRATSEAGKERLVSSLQERVNIRGNRARNVFDVTFEDRSRDKAEAVVAAIVNAFVEDSLLGQGTDTERTERALEAEISDHESRLELAESELARFKRENLGYMPNDRGDFFGRLQAAISAQQSTDEKIAQLTNRRDELLRQIAGVQLPTGVVAGAEFGCSRQEDLSKSRADLAALKLNFTDRHPRIIGLKETIDALLELCDEERRVLENASSPSGQIGSEALSSNPIYQNMRIQLSEAEAELASLSARLASEKNSVKELRRDVNKITEVEASLAQLNRDYDVIQGRYQVLLTRRETLRSRQRLDPVTDTVQFRILEPPFAPETPVGPPRSLILLGAFVFALGAGGVMAFGLNQLHPVFYTRRSVRKVSGLPVLGSVSMLRTHEQERFRIVSALTISSAYGLLILATGAVIAFNDVGSYALRRLLGMGTV